MLLERCPFLPSNELFQVNPSTFDSLPVIADRVRYLIRRFNLPFEQIAVQVHSDMAEPGKVIHTTKFDTRQIKLPQGHDLVSVEQDGTYIIRDKFHSGGPKKITVKERLPTLTAVAMHLNQNFLHKGQMGAIIAHETAHLYLHAHGIQTLNTYHSVEMERTTDVAAFVIGLGDLYLRGGSRSGHYRERPVTQMLGYLSPDDMRFVNDYVLGRITAPRP
jgi:hypothetical protein